MTSRKNILYLARTLHLPSGEIQGNVVVNVCDGVVTRCFPFEQESQSMLLADELYVCYDVNGALMVERIVI